MSSDFPNHWQVINLENALDELIDYRGKTPTKTDTGIPLITAKIVKNGSVLPATEFISSDDYDSWMTRGFPAAGDILLTTEAPLGEVAQLQCGNVALAQRIILLRGKKSLLNNDYLLYLMQSNYIQDQLEARSSGSTVKGIKQSELRKINLVIPSKHEQKQIAKILGDLDRKINNNIQINQTLEAIAQAIFKSWFVDFDPVHAKQQAKLAGLSNEEMNLAAMRVISSKTDTELEKMVQKSPAEYENLKVTASYFPDEFEESELGMIPKGWKVSSFKSWCDIKRGKNITKAKVTDGNIPVVAGGIEPAYYHNKYNVEGPVITISASGANAGYINLYFQNIWSSDSSYIDQNSIPYFYTSYVCLKYYQDTIFSMQTGAAQPHIYPKDFERLNIVLPDNNILLKMEECISSFFLQISHNKSENVNLIGIRDSLLPKLLSGEIEVV